MVKIEFEYFEILGYRESVNMSQVRTFIEMDSHEERVFAAVRQTQEREAKQKMREKAKELSKLQRTQQLTQKSMMSSTTLPVASTINEVKAEPSIGDRGFSNSHQITKPRVRFFTYEKTILYCDFSF